MAYEWVAPVASAVTVVATVTVSWLTNRRAMDNQLKLVAAQQAREQSREIRAERLSIAQEYMKAIQKFEENSASVSADFDEAFAPVAERLGMVRPAGGWQSLDFTRIRGAMTDEDREQLEHANLRLLELIDEFDRSQDLLLLCGSDGVRNTAGRVREDVFTACDEIRQGKNARYLDPEVRHTLLTELRADLGYATQPHLGPDRKPRRT